MTIIIQSKKMFIFASEIVPNNLITTIMKENFSKKLDLNQLTVYYREYVLCSDVKEVSQHGVWIETLFGERTFIARSELRLMAEFLAKSLV